MNRLVRTALRKYIRAGNLRITTARGATYALGDGSGKPVALRFTTAAAERGVTLDPELKLGESYVDGTLVVEQGSIDRCNDRVGDAGLADVNRGLQRVRQPFQLAPLS